MFSIHDLTHYPPTAVVPGAQMWVLLESDVPDEVKRYPTTIPGVVLVIYTTRGEKQDGEKARLVA